MYKENTVAIVTDKMADKIGYNREIVILNQILASRRRFKSTFKYQKDILLCFVSYFILSSVKIILVLVFACALC